MRIKELVAWARERHSITLKKQRGEPKPWTQDPILMNYRFTNAYRELDKVTVWIREHWRTPHQGDRQIWLMMTISRFLNNIPCFEDMPFVNSWQGKQRDNLLKILKNRKAQGLQVFGGAYMVRSDPGCKIDYLDTVLSTMWEDREAIINTIKTYHSLKKEYLLLCDYRGMGSFMAAQVIADLKHTVEYKSAEDWNSFAASGPGSQRGLCRVLGIPPSHTQFSEDEWYEAFMILYKDAMPIIRKTALPRPDAQDFQGWLCEFDKYERTRLGEGRPRSKYPGSA